MKALGVIIVIFVFYSCVEHGGGDGAELSEISMGVLAEEKGLTGDYDGFVKRDDSSLGTSGGEKELVLPKENTLSINLTEMFNVDPSVYIVTDVLLVDQKTGVEKSLGELTTVNSVEYIFQFYPNSNGDQKIVFVLKDIIDESGDAEVSLSVVMADKKEVILREKTANDVDVVVSILPGDHDMKKSLEQDKVRLQDRFKNEFTRAFGNDGKNLVSILNLKIADSFKKETFENTDLSKKIEVVFADTVDVMDLSVTCVDHLIYYVPLSYLTDDIEGAIADAIEEEGSSEEVCERVSLSD